MKIGKREIKLRGNVIESNDFLKLSELIPGNKYNEILIEDDPSNWGFVEDGDEAMEVIYLWQNDVIFLVYLNHVSPATPEGLENLRKIDYRALVIDGELWIDSANVTEFGDYDSFYGKYGFYEDDFIIYDKGAMCVGSENVGILVSSPYCGLLGFTNIEKE